MQETKAMDIVLIPSKEIYDLSIELSTNLNMGIEPIINLNETHLPHITLVQLFIRDDRMNDLFNHISKAIKEIDPLNLTIIGLKKDHNNTVGININLSFELNKFYKLLMDITLDFEENEVNKGFLLDYGEVVRKGTVEWVLNYRNKLKYNPHITLAKDPIVEIPLIVESEFIVDRLAICHLGNYCTCRKIIKEWKLN